MLEPGFNQTTYGKAILAACFINDLGTVLALRVIYLALHKENLTLARDQLGVTLDLAFRDAFSNVTGPRIRTGDQVLAVSAVRTWQHSGLVGNEAVLSAYIIGMVLAGCAGKDHFLIRRLHSSPPELCRGPSRRLVFGCS
jgi:hypothetical protein